jgi:hypothetical protein
LRDARELVEPAEVVGQGGDVALLERAEVGVSGRSVQGPAALGQLGGEVGPPPLEEAEPGDGFEEAAERDLHVEGAVVGGVRIDEQLAQAGLALVGDAVDLAFALLVAAAGLRLARRRFALVPQDRPLTADGAGHRAEEPGPGVINRADGAGQLEPVERGVEGAERDAPGPAGELGHPLLQFIAVRLMLLEDPKDRHLDHEGKSIDSIYRAATIGSHHVDVRTTSGQRGSVVGVRRCPLCRALIRSTARAARVARDVRRPPRVGPCRARVLGARRTDVVSPPRPTCARSPSDPATTRPIYSRCGPGLPVEPPRPHLRPQPRPCEPRGPPGLNRSSGRTTIAGSSRRVLVALTLPAAWLADNGRAGLRSTMTCAVWRAGPDAGWIQVSFRRWPSGVRLRYVFGVPLACGGPALLLTGSVAAACPKGGRSCVGLCSPVGRDLV